MSPPIRALLLLFIALGLSGCYRKPLQVADKTIPLPKTHGSYHLVREAESRACQFNLFYLIPLGGNQLWKAKDAAVGSDADGLIDVTVDTFTVFTPLGPVNCTEVRGLAVRYGQAPEGYGPVVIREEVHYVEQPAPSTTASVQPSDSKKEEGVEGDGAPEPAPVAAAASATSAAPTSRARAEAMIGVGMWQRGFGVSLRELLYLTSPGISPLGTDSLELGLGFDAFLTGDRSLIVPLQLRYTAHDAVMEGMDLYGFGEVGFRRSPYNPGRGHAGFGVGGRYTLHPNAHVFLELGLPTLRGGIQVTF